MGALEYIKNVGIKQIIRNGIQYAIGLGTIQEEIDSLYYYLNSYCDITKIPPTKDINLRLMQLAMVELLRIFDKLCKKHNLKYWLDSGNLIGAVRHNGFIPWDDDLDVGMLREDYDRMYPIFKETLAEYGILVIEGGIYDDYGYMRRIGFNYKTAETGVWMDVFPLDRIEGKKEAEDLREELTIALKKYRKFYRKNEKRLSVEKLTERKNQILSKYPNLSGGDKISYVIAPEFIKKDVYIFPEEVIFPLDTHLFEGVELPIPRNSDFYLKQQYNGDYMSFPRFGLEHHNDPDGNSAATRAIRHNVNMKDVISYLHSVYEKV